MLKSFSYLENELTSFRTHKEMKYCVCLYMSVVARDSGCVAEMKLFYYWLIDLG